MICLIFSACFLRTLTAFAVTPAPSVFPTPPRHGSAGSRVGSRAGGGPTGSSSHGVGSRDLVRTWPSRSLQLRGS